jgi:hypothetical protein
MAVSTSESSLVVGDQWPARIRFFFTMDPSTLELGTHEWNSSKSELRVEVQSRGRRFIDCRTLSGSKDHERVVILARIGTENS